MDDRYQRIWDEYHDGLLGYIRQRVSDPYDAEDILQDVYVSIYKGIDNLNDLTKLKSWVYRITKHRIIDYYRKRKDMPTEAAYFEMMSDDEDSNANLNDTISKCLQSMIEELPDNQQEAIEQHDIRGMRHKEISEKSDITISSSKMRVHRGKAKLKEILLACCDFEVDAYGNVVDYKMKKDRCTRCDC